MARCNISHFPDSPYDIDTSVKGEQRKRFKKWLDEIRRNMSVGKKSRKHLSSDACAEHVLVLEVGSGQSDHGLRAESELLCSTHPTVGFSLQSSFIRINRDIGTIPSPPNEYCDETSTFIRMNAVDAFERLHLLVIGKHDVIASKANDGDIDEGPS